MHFTQKAVLTTSMTIIAASILAACGGNDDDSNASAPPALGSVTYSGVVATAKFTPGSATDPTLAAAYYVGAKVCVDANGNGVCEASESPVVTDSKGHFSIVATTGATLIADIGTDATLGGAKLASRDVLRIASAQLVEQAAATVVISPLSAEIMRTMEADDSDYATAKANLATRLGVAPASLIADVNTVTGAEQKAMLAESKALDNRFTYAVTKLDRKDLYPDALATPGGDPTLATTPGVSSTTSPAGPDTRKPITFAQAQQAAFAVEGIPRYDAVFVVMLENKATSSILNSAFAPNINALLKSGNQLTSYYATGNPSEPNYTALGGADDWGITDDSQWNCDATGANAVQDLPMPDKTAPGLANSPFTATCTQPSGVNHNIVGKPNLFNALTAAGLTWRTYNESMNPGQDFRIDSVGDAAVVVADHVYAPGTVAGNGAQIGTTGLMLPLPASLYKTKHHPGMAYQNVRSAPEWAFSNRTLGGGQWDAEMLKSTAYAIPPGYNVDQFGTDLANGAVGQLNFIMPDQCDDMHGVTVKSASGVLASDCGSVSNGVAPTAAGVNVARADKYVGALVKRIQDSPLWKNPQKRVAIILMFDEGNATSGFNSCCGWVPSNTTTPVTPMTPDANGTFKPDATINNYKQGNHGHGESIFAIVSNQGNAPKGVSDNDVYSHFSLVRTFQDMFQLADPAVETSYMNRSKYTEHFIAQNILNLQEYAGSADTHFDSVRPINHAWVAPSNYVPKQSGDVATPPQQGPDANQTNVWALTAPKS
jgi:hypothetical protein